MPHDPPPSDRAAPPTGVSLNDSQKRAVLFGLLDLHQRMADMEAMLTQSLDPSPFSRYVNDLSPTEAKVVRDYFGRLRSRMLACLQETGIPLEVRRTSLRWGLQCGMSFLNIAVAEISPDRLRGYGSMDAAGAEAVVKIQQELDRLIDRVAAYLRQGLGRDLPQRLARLEAAPADAAGLTLLERVVTRWGLVEFRPALDQIVRRLEAPQFEIAVFGRVSSGKSSLLNHVAGMDVLPVGVTPITAVPTRLVRGERPAAFISFAEGRQRTVAVEELREYASEEGNPGNHKHVTGVLVQLPSPRLREGIVLVDTPGVGSLARSGGSETFAYLPYCDLGVVLIDAASTLTPDDLDLLRLLYEAAVPAQVVLSKADLLTPADRERTGGYVREQLRRELSLDLAVHPVSTVGADEGLLTRWFEEEIEPLLARHRALAEASLRRKIAHLRESVAAALQTLLARGKGGGPDGRPRIDEAVVRRLLDGADRAVREAQGRAREWTADASALAEVIVRDAAEVVVSAADKHDGATDGPVLSAARRVLAERDQAAHGLLTELRQTLTRTLEGLRRAAPMAAAEVAPLRDLTFRGLPAADLSSLRPKAARPWWAAAVPRLAAWAVRGDLRGRLGPALQEQVTSHDRRLQAWLRACLGQLVEAYEAQAEIFREQARRLAGGGNEDAPAAERDVLRTDLEALQPTQGAGAEEGRRGPAG